MMNKSQLPINFAGRVLKLEMSLDKGIGYVTMDDVNNLMDLYTQAVEFYDSSYEEDRQKYYQQKLIKLMHSPLVQRLSQGPNEPKKERPEDEVSVKIYDQAPLNQISNKTMSEALVNSEK